MGEVDVVATEGVDCVVGAFDEAVVEEEEVVAGEEEWC